MFRGEYLHQPTAVANAMGIQLTALLTQFDSACRASDDLEAAARDHFERHPDVAVLTSFPGMGTLIGARLLAEIGDDHQRFVDARSLKVLAGSAPVIRASDKKPVITYRRIKNNRLAAAGSIWALAALTTSPGAKRHFRTRREHGDWNRQAQRHLFNKFLGQLHHCLQTGISYNETHAFHSPRFDRACVAGRARCRLFGFVLWRDWASWPDERPTLRPCPDS